MSLARQARAIMPEPRKSTDLFTIFNQELMENPVLQKINQLKDQSVRLSLLAVYSSQQKRQKIQQEIQKHADQLSLKFQQRIDALLQLQQEIIQGRKEVFAKDCLKPSEYFTNLPSNGSGSGGIPQYWQKCLKQHQIFNSPQDQQILRHIVGLAVKNDQERVTLQLTFSKNQVFKNRVLLIHGQPEPSLLSKVEWHAEQESKFKESRLLQMVENRLGEEEGQEDMVRFIAEEIVPFSINYYLGLVDDQGSSDEDGSQQEEQDQDEEESEQESKGKRKPKGDSQAKPECKQQ